MLKRALKNINAKIAMETKNNQHWTPPQAKPDSYRTGLRVTNSLWKGDTVEFIPIEGRKINWYICGPTVYSDSHLGHAKTYLCFDVIRKILERYFRYEVKQVMNITNIDDKIIQRSNETGEEFFEFSDKWEKDFFQVCGMLGVDKPNVITRVTEYVPEIVAYIEGIIKNGFAYESNGSVYFNVEGFKTAENHNYPKLEPLAAEDNEKNPELQEGDFSKEKKSKKDFALWKKAKEGEPSWDSPWGKGRPGWHIECSAMCDSEIKSLPVDMHTGGDDLQFPHHDNEIAQSEAYHNCGQWMNYFLHTGRLNINGEKMSKSEKNFTTIKKALETTTPRILRLFYSLTRYNHVLNYDKDDNFSQATNIDKKLSEFFKTLQTHLRDQNDKVMAQKQKPDELEREVTQKLDEVKLKVHTAFCDDFNTPKVLSAIQELMKKTNDYIANKGEKSNWCVLNNVYIFTKETLHCMGFSYELNNTSKGNESKVIDLLVQLRSDVRKLAKETKNSEMFDLCNKYRNLLMQDFQVQLKDEGDNTVWSIVDKTELEREAKIQKAKEEALKKKKQEEEKKKDEKMFHPSELFMKDGKLAKKYSKFQKDENGIPIAMSNGDPLSKKVRAYCEKEYNKYLKKYEAQQQK